MSTQTTNLHLVKPADGEAADIGVINGNMDTIDSAVGTLQQSVTWQLLGTKEYSASTNPWGQYDLTGISILWLIIEIPYNGEKRFASGIYPKSVLTSSERRVFYLGGGWGSSSINAFAIAQASLTEFAVGNAYINGTHCVTGSKIYAYGR